MIVYNAGNFDLLIYGKKERKMKNLCTGLGYDYNRLISYFENHRNNSIIELKKECIDEENKGKTPKIKRRKLKKKS